MSLEYILHFKDKYNFNYIPKCCANCKFIAHTEHGFFSPFGGEWKPISSCLRGEFVLNREEISQTVCDLFEYIKN